MSFNKAEQIKQTLRDAAYHAMRDAILEGLPPVGIAVLTKDGRMAVGGPICHDGANGQGSSFETAEQVLDTALRAMFARKSHMPSLDEVLVASFRVEADLQDPYDLDKRTERFFFAPS